jgi:hypothetical protein
MSADQVVIDAWRQYADQLADDIAAEPPRCEATCCCPDHDGERCSEPATERVSVLCAEPGCTAAAEMLLLCHDHADDAATTHTVTRRRL